VENFYKLAISVFKNCSHGNPSAPTKSILFGENWVLNFLMPSVIAALLDLTSIAIISSRFFKIKSTSALPSLQ
jgi:mevalonate kinase